MIILSKIRDHFPARRMEWICAGIMAGIGLRLLDPGMDSFSQPSFAELSRWASEGMWGTIMFLTGVLRLVVLDYNGAWKPSPELRGFFAILGGTIWIAFAIGLEAAGTATPGAITYAFLVLGEASNIWTAAGDARTPYGERVTHGKHSG